ncbi:MAG: alpha-ribazole phosphatase [bacterium]|nr:alpha-ribazole phosphatase [bacterium]
MDVYLIRHTRVNVATGVCYGRSDVALADSYIEEWKDLCSKLPLTDVELVFSSPLSRCHLFAKYLQAADLKVDPRLVELDFGQWELQTWDAINAQQFDGWAADVAHRRCPGGESYQEQFQRAAAFWDECTADKQKHSCMFVVTHSGFIRALLAYILEIPLEKSLRLGLDFGSVTKIHFVQDVPIVDYVNR